MDRLTSMEAFVRVVEAGSFTDAARRWGRSKAVVSKYVSQLEVHLAVSLLRRTTRSLSLTEAGRAYYDHCQDLLGEIERVEAEVREDHVSPRGLLRVTAPPGFMSRYLRVMTTAFVCRYPGVTMELDLTHRMVDLVEERIDVAIRLTRPVDSSLIARRLAPAPIIAVASPDYVDANTVPLEPRDLVDHACIVDTNYRDQNRWPFHAGGKIVIVEVSGPFRVNSPTIVRNLAVAGHGIALVPRMLVEDALLTGDLVEVLAGTVALDWSVYAVTARRKFLSGRVRAFIEHLSAALHP